MARVGVLARDRLVALVTADPAAWRPLALTNGCFDLLHAGHVRYLAQAKALAKTLIVGINSDASVRALKGPDRPIVPERQRAEVVAALHAVDGVTVFAETTANDLILALRPDMYIKGGDYRPETLPEAPTLEACGTKLVLIPIEVATSTTAIAAKLSRPQPVQ
ncbi:MAG: adenylyltransferase/cytidyltransferase family protein [Pseudanabaenaceae cyanobacterium]